MRISIRSAHRLRLTALLVGLTISTVTGCDNHASNAHSHLPPPPSSVSTDSHRDPVAALVGAFAAVESSGVNEPPYLDCSKEHNHTPNCYAFGLYAFHRARWAECSGVPRQWGTASTGEQDRVMRTAIARYTRRCPYLVGTQQWVVWCSNYHNLGHGSMRRTPYVTRMLKEYSNGR